MNEYGDPEFGDIEAAAARIERYVRHTPVLASVELSRALGSGTEFKCESLQSAGAFKSRGACNAVFALDDASAARGVATHSSGNHAAALSRAARLRGIPAYIVMPRGAPRIKRAAVEGFGGRIQECEPTLAAREAAAAELVAATGATLVHPYDDPQVIAGQGTIVVELAAQTAAPDVVLVPVGGGGLLSGTALACRRLWPGARVVGAEPAGADDAFRSFASGALQPQLAPQTIADGLRGALSARTFRIARANADEIVTVGEASIVAAMRLVFDLLKVVIEPSSAVPVAALLEGKVRAARVVVVLSGGNVDLDALPWSAAAPVIR
ncbi:MAG TPA: pyridoxal-phosphate dependent enzyme [Steroidobacteraceae bacterium]|nr:pyridoxal-phosphate dependent enzyme [Steroidobacteraceae bacterium]